uniref:NADH-ubiquinone oxidoreductase chain 4 n=1 Tax=Evania appendigaster TaxID=27486 RepID=C8YLY2_EVAAP|nr:NADH dehydrogenase subunit 4 [Evania appendigaster]ACL36007.1 NADH dehydrogenase subunit 4 [Evania appendigaster]
MLKLMFFLLLVLYGAMMLNSFNVIYFYSISMVMLMFMLLVFEDSDFLFCKIYYKFSVFSISWSLILLSVWISVCMGVVNQILRKSCVRLVYLMLILLSLLIGFFFSLNLMVFYLFFEMSLLPMFLMVMGWGGSELRYQAGLSMMVYAFFSSLPFFGLVFMILYKNGSLDFIIFKLDNILQGNLLFYILLLMIFLVKLPMFMMHMWLPKAHVEAPVFGSMMLAGVLLKLGGYGIFIIYLMAEGIYQWVSGSFILYNLMGGFYISLMCLFQLDLKVLIAYSSVVHMSFMLGGMSTLMEMGMMGSIMMMIGHGLCSSGLFCLVNYSYDVLNSRSVILNKGLLNLNKSLSLLWFFLCIFNLGAPLSINFFSEIFLLNGLMKWSGLIFLNLIFLMFFNSCYNFHLFGYTQHGVSMSMNFYSKVNAIDYLLMFIHIFPLVLLVLMMDVFIF